MMAVKTNRVMPPVVVNKLPAGCGSKDREKKNATRGMVCGSSEAGIDEKAERLPGAVSAAGGEPGGLSVTVDCRLGEKTETLTGADSAVAS